MAELVADDGVVAEEDAERLALACVLWSFGGEVSEGTWGEGENALMDSSRQTRAKRFAWIAMPIRSAVERQRVRFGAFGSRQGAYG